MRLCAAALLCGRYFFYGNEHDDVDELITFHYHSQGNLLGVLTRACRQS